jgi:hypothetical protein
MLITSFSDRGHQNQGLSRLIYAGRYFRRRHQGLVGRAGAMRTPSRISASEFSQSLKDFLNHSCILSHHRLYCAMCGTPIVYVRASLLLHEAACPVCVSVASIMENRAWNTMVPYCPNCEEKPAEHGCLHPPEVPVSRAA